MSEFSSLVMSKLSYLGMSENNDKQFAFTKVDFSQKLLPNASPKTTQIVLVWQ